MFNKMISNSLPFLPQAVVRWVARRYVAGETIEEAVMAVQRLSARGAVATLDVLGEFVQAREQAIASTAIALHGLDQILENQLHSGISVKLTSLGLEIDEEFCYDNLVSIVEKARIAKRFVRIDMENSPYTTRTFGLYHRLRQSGFNNVGVVIQACMRRSEADIHFLAGLQASVRLCKGIYLEPREIAFQGKEEISENYKKLLVLLFNQKMHVAIATHDESLIGFSKEHIATHCIGKDRYEFQMLLGVREAKRDELIKEGFRVRIYVPYGQDWYGYCLRRLKENPQIVGHVMRAMLFERLPGRF